MHLSRLSPRLASLVVLVTALALGLSGCDLMQDEWAECEDNVAISNTYNETGWEIEEYDCNATAVPTTCVVQDDYAGCVPIEVPPPSARFPLAWSNGAASIAADSAELEIDGEVVAYGSEPVVGGGITGSLYGADLTVDWTSRPDLSARLAFDFVREGEAWALDFAHVEVHARDVQNVYTLYGGQRATERPSIRAPLGAWWRGDVTLQIDEHARLTLRNAHIRAMK